ncbi:MAG: hypothetical protein LBG21_03470 [Campylobacteraceae bacterium]|nr:hypothetical protein [Campylobacteraceae bacterium]
MKQFFRKRSKTRRFLDALKQIYYDRFHKTYDNRVIFVDTKRITIIGDLVAFDVILSPKYYWIKIETLPVKYTFQAKEYAPSVFEGFIPKGDYSYKAIKQGDKFLLFAYDAKDILENLESLGIKTSLIRRVYFAQTEFAHYSFDIKIDNKNALVIHNGKVIKAPLSLTKEHVGINEVLQKLKPSKNTIKLGKFNRFYEKQGALKSVIYALIFLIVLFFAELVYLINVSNSNENRREEILKQYSLPSTEIQLNALLKQNERINKEQKTIRDKTNEIFKFPLQEGEYFKSIDISKTQISLTLHVNNRSRSDAVRSYFKRFSVIDDFKDDTNNDIKVKLRYE